MVQCLSHFSFFWRSVRIALEVLETACYHRAAKIHITLVPETYFDMALEAGCG